MPHPLLFKGAVLELSSPDGSFDELKSVERYDVLQSGARFESCSAVRFAFPLGGASSAPQPLNSARLFAALGDENRLRLVARLCKGPASITGLSEGFDITRQAVTKHLRVMRNSGLVRSKRRGRQTIWQLSEHRLQDARRHLDLISKQWDEALARLRTFVER